MWRCDRGKHCHPHRHCHHHPHHHCHHHYDTTNLPPPKVEDVVEAISEAVTSEVETELINASHTNVLLLRQVIHIF